MSGSINQGSTPGTVAWLAPFPQLANAIRDGWLDGAFADALTPAQLFRAGVKKEKWTGGRIGETTTFTRRGLLKVNTSPRKPGVDPTPQAQPGIEQWTITAQPYNDTLDTSLINSSLSIVKLFDDDTRKLGFQAGQTLNHIVRNRLFSTYSGGQTYITATKNSDRQHVAYLQGFRYVLVNGRPAPVSAAHPLTVSIGGTTRTVIGELPDYAELPDGPGILILGSSISATLGDVVLASNRPFLLRVGGAATSNGIVSTNVLTMDYLRQLVVRMRRQYVPLFPDGTYHLDVDSVGESQLFADDEFQRLFRGTEFKSKEYGDLMLGKVQGISIIRNEECPTALNTDSEYDAVAFDTEVQVGVHAGLPIHRAVLSGYGAIVEHQLPDFEQEAQIGKVGNFSVVSNGGITVDVSGIKYILRPPLDRLQSLVAQTWSWNGDWGFPSDTLSGDAAMYKRACVIEFSE